jgi:hypothetical protein
MIIASFRHAEVFAAKMSSNDDFFGQPANDDAGLALMLRVDEWCLVVPHLAASALKALTVM